ncbi:myelin-oligodendrocyte glycoprotein-like [Girardinichthys multiradiatus]|uniref:myelin-oligodendrocyte glycoprotein-like n=1 Tax=Girardinichthys multiradiatus TaxID=208333 RepID=UPI001FAC4478|nr:myelin-oligodendrocyte glycoprotein-like [Girardinichthys multiradiatus]
MAASTLLLLWVLVSECFSGSTNPDQKNINAEPGQNIILPCRAPDSRPVIVVEWTRNDLEPQSVFLYRDAQIDQLNQHPRYKNRVELRDRKMKDGDVSLTLKNVRSDDRGSYECRVVHAEAARRFNLGPISIINLDVAPRSQAVKRGTKLGPTGLMIGLTSFLLAVGVGFELL